MVELADQLELEQEDIESHKQHQFLVVGQLHL